MSNIRLPTLATALCAAVIASSPVARADSSTPQELRVMQQERAAFGLSSDLAYVASLVGSDSDAGMASWGMLLTEEELEALELNSRARFESEVGEALMPYLRRLSTYAGAWYDQEHDGRLIILLTAKDEEVSATVMKLIPRPSRGVRFEYVSTTWADLEESLQRLGGMPLEAFGGARPVEGGIDVRHNRLFLAFSADDTELVRSTATDVSRKVGVAVHYRTAEQGHDAEACQYGDDKPRWNCWNQLRAGDMVFQHGPGRPENSRYVESRCTMGFHIIVPDTEPREQFLTAGHCGYHNCAASDPSLCTNNFYHSPYYDSGTKVGSEKDSLYIANSGDTWSSSSPWRDIMRVAIADETQLSSRIYATPKPYYIKPADWPVEGQIVCASMGYRDVIDCGFIADVTMHWMSETADPDIQVWGSGFTGIAVPTVGGDSGSPIYSKYEVGGVTYITPLGILDHEADGSHSGMMAKVMHGLQAWPGSYVYTGH